MKLLTSHLLKFVWADRPTRQRGTVIIAIPLTCLFVAVIAIAWVRDRAIQTRTALDKSKQILQQTDRLLKTAVDAETGIRGYGLTRRKEFLEPYLKAKANLPELLQKLRVKVQANPTQLQGFQKLKKATEQEIIFLEKTLNNFESLGVVTRQSQKVTEVLIEGKFQMDTLRQDVAEFVAHQEEFQTSLERQIRKWIDITNTVQLGALFVGLFGGGASWYLFDRLDRELTKREVSLQESKTRIQAVVDNAADGILTLDDRGNINSFNLAAERIFNMTVGEAVGQNFRRLIAKPLGEDCQENSLEYFLINSNAKLNVCQQEILGLRKDGVTFPMELAVSEMRLASERLFIGICRDITERKNAEGTLRKRAEELANTTRILSHTAGILRKRNQELDQFAYVVSHDLKAPLRAIANLSSWIEEDLTESMTEDTQHQMNLLRGRVHRMEALIDALLQYSRVGRIQTALETVDVGILLAEIIDSIAPPETFTVKVEPEMPTLVTERVLLQQVFSNLISNAVKHHNSKSGTVNISVNDKHEFYEFVVADDGPGIAPQYHDKVFVIFQTLEARDKVENTGIGLSLVKKIVENQGGTIQVESSEGEGATFRFTWSKQPIQQNRE
ncbi:MAG TPA: ATP-binding protein [Kamptonema sp.]|nr:ATP-binding protein [Kamptonema sp.]